MTSKRLFDIEPDVDQDPNDLESMTAQTRQKTRRDANALKKRALQAIAENPDE